MYLVVPGAVDVATVAGGVEEVVPGAAVVAPVVVADPEVDPVPVDDEAPVKQEVSATCMHENEAL